MKRVAISSCRWHQWLCASRNPSLKFSVPGAAAELGPLASLMLAPEEGSWGVDEVTVSSSRTGHTDRFVCKEPLGALGFLSPVPPGAVVYGSGETAVVLTRVRLPWQPLWRGGRTGVGIVAGRAAQECTMARSDQRLA